MTDLYDTLLEQYRTFTLGRCLVLVILILLFWVITDATRNSNSTRLRSNTTPNYQEYPHDSTERLDPR